MNRILPVLLIALVLVLVYAFIDGKDTRTAHETRFAATDAASGDAFGHSVAVSGDHVLIGAHGDDDGGRGSGSAYLYQSDGKGGWSEHKFTASDAAEGDAFGFSVAMSGNNVLIGAYRDDDGGRQSGSAYLYQPDGLGGWTEHKFTASDAIEGALFGISVSVSGDDVLVGASGDPEGGSSSGGAYLFQSDGLGGWKEHKFTAIDAEASDFFGISVALSGDKVVVGAYGDDNGGADSGSAYLFQRNSTNGWNERKFTATDARADARFGFSVGVSREAILVGALGDDDGGRFSGAAYLYEEDSSEGWTEHKFTANDAAAEDLFGYAVALDDHRVLIGAPGDSRNGNYTGSAYLYEENSAGGWTESRYSARGEVAEDWFGRTVALSGSNLLMGAPGDQAAMIAPGRAYLLDIGEG